MITCSFLNLQKPIEAELWAQRALEVQSDRPEALLRLVTYFRERSIHCKAWHYLLEVEKRRGQKELVSFWTLWHTAANLNTKGAFSIIT